MSADGSPVDRVLGEVDELEAELAGQRPHEVGLGDGALLDQQLADGHAPLGLGFKAASSWAWVIRPSDSSISPSGWRKSRVGSG